MNSGSGDRGEILTDAMLAALPHHLRPVTTGGRVRSGCPFHGSDRQRSLTVNAETGRFQCFSCGVWGYTEHARAEYLERVKADADRTRAPRRQQPWERPSGALKLRNDAKEPEPLPDEWRARLASWRAALPEAAEYLEGRRIPLELVRQLGGGVGTLGGARRLVLPHTTPAGELVSLYGRRIDAGDEAKHHHLAGRAKGWLNAPIVSEASELWICEGPFDALALMAAGIPNAVAVFGVQGIRWNWLPRSTRRLVLAFDCDEAGRKAILEHAPQAIIRGLDVLQVMPDELGGAKDIAEAWQAGTLRLTGIPGAIENKAVTVTNAPIDAPGDTLLELVQSIPEQPPAGFPADRWTDYLRLARRFAREHGATAQAAGWDELSLFGLPDPARPWEGGALWALAGCEIREVTAGHIRAVSAAGASYSCWRHYIIAGALPWAVSTS